MVGELPNVEDEEVEQVIDLIGRLTTAAVFLSRATMAARDGLPLPRPDLVDQSALQALGALEQRFAAGSDPLA
ncbi:hypothetical protein [Azospirillum sp. B510]|uniref:hypothetical protein n=1 Tax=Azospirillum sp. (strain B510) TaxID=137722 RepID=UPI0002D7F1F4|nr:hypothetical protein [Azospirillum sp. B510]